MLAYYYFIFLECESTPYITIDSFFTGHEHFHNSFLEYISKEPIHRQYITVHDYMEDRGLRRAWVIKRRIERDDDTLEVFKVTYEEYDEAVGVVMSDDNTDSDE